jgi:hypothetical protein
MPVATYPATLRKSVRLEKIEIQSREERAGEKGKERKRGEEL